MSTIQAPQAVTRIIRVLLNTQKLLVLLLLAGGMGLFTAQLSRAAVTQPHQTGAGFLYFTDEQGHRTQALHMGSRFELDIKGMSARVQLHQTFTNETDRWVEGVYVFPLPDDSAVNYLRMHIGDRVITGRIRERQAARAEYQAARREGRRAALTEQERPNLFTQSVANIGPGESVTVELHYVQSVQFDSGSFRLRLPTTLTPRFIPEASGFLAATQSVNDAHRITPDFLPVNGSDRNHMELRVQLEAGMPLASVDSSSHEIVLQRLGGGNRTVHDIRLVQGLALMDRDFELQWWPSVGQTPEAALFRESYRGHEYLQLMLLPPQNLHAGSAMPRELILIIDTSGSMQGLSIVQARQSLLLALDSLLPGDRFNVIEFNSRHTSLFPDPVPADRHNIDLARRFVNNLQAGGGTVMIPPLYDALRPGTHGTVKQVVFITDGSVGNEQQVLNTIRQNIREASLFTVGIGSAPNSFLLREAARIGRGTHTHIGSAHQVVERMGELFRKLESPTVTGIDIQWPAAEESYPPRIPDLYLGEPIFVHTRLPATVKAGDRITVSGYSAGQRWQRQLAVPGAGEHQGDGIPALPSQWAREKIGSLLDGNLGRRHSDELREQVLSVALQYQLLSPFTSFVAVEETVSRPYYENVDTHSVPNQRPAGQVVAYPQTATDARQKLLVGLLFALLALTLFLWARRSHGRP